MFFKKAHTPEYNEFAAELEKNLQQAEQAPAVEKQAHQTKAVQHLLKAAEILDDMGLTNQAAGITQILEKFAWEVPKSDPATSGLTPEKMVSNLENNGTVFNVTDGDVIDVAEPDAGETVEMKPDGELEVTDKGDAADGDGMAMNPMNPINPGPMASIAAVKRWPADAADPYGEEQVDLDLRHILKKK